VHDEEGSYRSRVAEQSNRASGTSVPECGLESDNGSNSVVVGLRPQQEAEGGGVEQEMSVDVNKEEDAVGEARKVTMAKTATATRTLTDTEMETVT
jgi:hypothetical protein